MKQSNYLFNASKARAAIAAALFATAVFTAAPALAAKVTAEDRVEARITDLHAKLKITAVQEAQWAKVSEIMRDNAKSVDALNETRFENAKTATAIDDLKSYGEITDAHANGVKKFIPEFEALYNEMSDVQKKAADNLFRHGGQKKIAKSE